jgi:hypothetical protein
MSVHNYEARKGRNRLSGRTQQRGSRMGLSGTGGILFGSIFVLWGLWMLLVGLKIMPIDPNRIKAPYWIFTGLGACITGAGLLVCRMAWRQIAADRRKREAQRLHPGEPALADYEWNPRGFEATRWRDALKTLMAAIFMTLFLTPFNWWALRDKQMLLWLIVGIFDVVMIFVWYQAVIMVGRAFKFGDSRIIFPHFPYRLGEPLVIHWSPPAGVGRITKGTFTLRCIEEWWEVRGTGKDRSKELVQEEIWNGTWEAIPDTSVAHGNALELEYNPPSHLPSTALNSDKPVFWEFEVKLDLAGFDFEQIYLVPIYGTGMKS